MGLPRLPPQPPPDGFIARAACGIVEHHERSLLKKYGGCLEIRRAWAQSFRLIQFVKRKGTKAARKVPEDFFTIKLNFLVKIKKFVTINKVPDQLIFNWD